MAYRIAVDAGHGSNTAGKRTPDGYREHYANVKVASYFAKAMERCNVSYIKVGWDDDNSKDDPDVSLSARQKTIKNAGCEYSISFHFNAFGDGKSYNSAEGIGTFISDKNSCVGDSKKMADSIQSQLIKGTKQKNRGVKRKALSMCNCSIMGTKASILIECAFMTNKRESELMQSDAFCLECAEEAAKGFCQYIGIAYVEPNANTSTPSQKPTTPSSTKKFMYNNVDYSPVFDPNYYANNNSDLKKAFGTNATKLFNHFTTYGMQEGRQAISTFNVNTYRARYADLQKAFGNNLPSYYKHYIQFGKKEGRSAV